jgi:flagellar hook-associated protein 2
MAGISSPGLGSGLDITSLVSQLVAAEGTPTLNRLDRQEFNLQARLSGLGQFKSAISTFQSSLSGLASLSAFQQSSATVGNDDVLEASTADTAATGVYSINVTKLAQSHALVTDQLNPFSSTNETIGTGELTIRFGSDPTGTFVQNINKGTHTITVDSSNNTLEGLRDAINDADIGVNATIINNGSGYLLSFASTESGADSAIEISVSDTGDMDDTDTNGLSRLSYNAAAGNLEQTIVAQDAAFSINGVNISSTSNSVSTAIEGVTLDLKDTGTSSLTVEQDSSVIREAVEEFVEGYNAFITTTNELTSFDPATGAAGILNGDFGVRSVVGQIQRQLGNTGRENVCT